MTTLTQPTILVIVGISGDLAKRKLLPALSQIASYQAFPKKFKIVGLVRRKLTVEDVLPDGDQEFLRKHLELYELDMTDTAQYVQFAERLKAIEKEFGETAQRLFYLAVPPQVSQPLVDCLGESGLAQVPDTKLLLEKPFGTDLVSAQELIEGIKKHFTEEQVYRIDHYLAKETAQNLVVFRSGNALFKRSWNNNFIERIDIIAAEKISVEGRAGFYEQTGALRDFVQSHLLQLAALTLMELPKAGAWDTIPQKRLHALSQLNMPTNVVRGQYDGYRSEVGSPKSLVETFVSLTLTSKDPRWWGVPITLTTGKSLNDKASEIRITFKREDLGEANQLVLRLQPNEGIELYLWAKRPGYERELQHVTLDFSYQQHFAGAALPDAYERVFMDAMRSDRSLFTTSDEVLETWRVLDPIQHSWEMHTDDLIMYKPGSTIEDVMGKA
ncbi:MAG TPA: glucose-6-phosphate dehydrogenase [Candidatus Saccharimonadales bacterium]|nr:glucose-6-phosphate dehydrogenase [Candidatus Saccharimonadales bacterium]